MQRGMQHWQQGILGLVAGVVLLALLGALPSTLTDRTYQAYSECPSGSGVTCVRVDASPMTVTVQDGTAGTPASAVPSKARYIAVNSSGVLTLIGCNATALINTAVAGTTQLVAAAATQRIYVCAWEVLTSSTTATNVNLVAGTGTNCGTGTTTISETVRFPGLTSASLEAKVSGAPFWRGLATAAGQALCVSSSGAAQVDGIVYYTQF